MLEINILLVDDHPDNLQVLELTLAELGTNLIKAASGEEALRQVMQREFAVILLDVYMTGMSGFETAALIKEHPKAQDTPIIFLTGMDVNDTAIVEGYGVGAVDY